MQNIHTPQTSLPVLRWSAPIRPNHERSKRWYVIAGSIAIGVSAYGIVTGAWTLSVVAVLCIAIYVLLRDHRHPDRTITLTDSGVTIAQKYLSWQDIRGYWLLFTPDYVELRFTPKDEKRADLKIQTGNLPIAELKDVLNRFVPELEDKHEHVLDFIIRICKL